MTACAALLLPSSALAWLPPWLLPWLRSISPGAPVLRWQLDEGGDSAIEQVSGTKDAIASRTGHAIWAGKGRERALRLDGYSVWFRHVTDAAIDFADGITLMAWVALEAYPVSEAAILQLNITETTAFRVAIDCFGYLHCGRYPGNADTLCRSLTPIGRATDKAIWVHITASMGTDGILLYRDGMPFGRLPHSTGMFSAVAGDAVVVGMSPDCGTVAHVFPTGVLNGLLRDVQVFDRQLSLRALRTIMAASKPKASPNLERNGPWCVDDPQRPLCHAQPPRAWTNEPYGLIHWGGQYHLFYQKNPDGPYWSRLNWGHLTSPDLLQWTEQPVALSPELAYESKGCWSGSAIEHAGRLTLIYTAVDEQKAGISLAFSEDGINFTKFPGNPVIPSPPGPGEYLDFRDPFVWREGDFYCLLVGSGVRGVGGTALLYRSSNLIEWEFLRQIYTGDLNSSGPFWEMPIFFRDGNRYALVVSELPGRASYWTGSWMHDEFIPLSSSPQHLELFNHLLSPTPIVDQDGQVVVMGIIPDERSSKEQWRAGWANLYSFPRVLSIDASGAITQRPHPCLDTLCVPLHSLSELALGTGSVHPVSHLAETSLRIRATFTRGQSSAVSLLVRRSPNGEEQTEILYDWERSRMVLERTRSSLDPGVKRDREVAEYVSAKKDSISLDVFVDRSVIEVFVDEKASFSARIYPTLDTSNGVAFAAVGSGAMVERLTLSRLQKPAPNEKK